MGAKKGWRRRGRTLALQVLFGFEFESPGRATLERAFADNPAVLDEPDEDVRGFALELVRGVCGRKDELDKVISAQSAHWKIGRIAKVELALLRLAIFEMLYVEDIPLKVAINEAIDLSKAYGDDRSRNFVNGILDGVAKAVAEGKIDGVSKSI